MSDAKTNEAIREYGALVFARGMVGFLFFYAFIMGCWIAGAGLHDPDTCWLLAVGKYTLEAGGIPHVDPFSWTFSLLGREFIPYQWLTEVLFYLSYKVAAGYSLLVLVDTVLVFAMFSGPLMLHRALRAPIMVSIPLIMLGIAASCFHFLARPEVFSYAFLIIMIGMIARTRLKIENRRSFDKRDHIIVLQLFGLFALWANMHTGFISGMAVLLGYAVCLSFEVVIFRKGARQVKAMSLAWLMVLGAIVGTFCNPFGVFLWKYIPELFFMPINKYINELKPLNLTHLDPTYYPYIMLALVMCVVLFRAAKHWRQRGRMPFGGTYSFVMSVAAFVGGLLVLRLIPFASMFLVGEIGWLLKGYVRPTRPALLVDEAADSSDEHQELPLETGAASQKYQAGMSMMGMAARINRKLLSILHESSSPVVLLAFSLFGVGLISVRVTPPTIPQDNAGFNAPYKAISHLSKERPAGKVFNDPQFGDMMIWYLISKEKPIMGQDPFQVAGMTEPADADASLPPVKVFIDTRFDMYGSTFVEDYYSISTLKPGWKDIFEKYRPDWAFLPAKHRLVPKIKEELMWNEIYRDEQAVMLKRP